MRSRVVATMLFATTLGASTACGSAGDSEPSTTAESATLSRSADVSALSTPDPAATESAVVIDVRIEGGSVTPTNERLDAIVGEPVTVRIDSDIEDELHVHSVPDHSFDVAATNGQSFEFTVDVPGTVNLELHGSSKTIATLLVRP